MKIDFTQSGINKWSVIGLYVVLVLLLVTKAFADASRNEEERWGNRLAYASGDTRGYILPMEHYICFGEYYLDKPEEKSIGRGPYYAVYYYIFRQFLDIPSSYDALVIFHILWFSIAIILLMLLLVRYLHYQSLVWLIPLLTIGIPLELWRLTYILPESLALSQLICFFFFYERFVRTGSWWQLGWSALFLSMACVMKPYLLPIFAFCFLDWTITNKVLCFNKWCQYVAIMSLPLVLICLPFTIRNAVKYQTFAPMQNTAYAGTTNDTVNAAMRIMVRTWGENHQEWVNNAVGTYFMPVKGFHYVGELPSSIYVDAYSADDLAQLAQECQRYERMEESPERDSLRCALVAIMTSYTKAYLAQHPCWRIKATLKQMKYLVAKEPFAIDHRYTGVLSVLFNAVKGVSWFIYYVLLLGGIVGLILLVIYCPPLRILAWVTLWLLLFFSLTLSGEHRFFLPAEYCCLIGFVFMLDRVITHTFGSLSHE